jgi:hypothetical protein
MRKIAILLMAATFSLSTNAGIIYVPSNSTDNAKAGNTAKQETVKKINAQTFLSLTPAKVQEMTGKKMTFSQKIALKIAQKSVKKQLKKANSIDIKDKSQMLRLWLIFGAIAIVATLLSWFVPFLWIITGLAWLACLIFFVLWIIALSAE